MIFISVLNIHNRTEVLQFVNKMAYLFKSVIILLTFPNSLCFRFFTCNWNLWLWYSWYVIKNELFSLSQSLSLFLSK